MGEKWRKEGKRERRTANFTLLTGCYRRSKQCKFSSNYFSKTTFSRVFIATRAYFTLYSSADCGWMEFDYFRIVTSGWVQESLVGWEKSHVYIDVILLLKSWEWVIFNGYVHHAHSTVHLYRIQQYVKRIPWGLWISMKSLCAWVLISKIWFCSLVDKVSLLRALHGPGSLWVFDNPRCLK